MLIRRIHHLGWAVRSLALNRRHFETQLGLEWLGQQEVGDVLVGFFGVGESMIELLEPLDAESDIALFLDRVGEGIHHVAYDVADIAEALRAAAASGLELIDQAPRSGARGTLIGFVNPLRSDGVLVEFVQDPHAPSGHTEGVS